MPFTAYYLSHEGDFRRDLNEEQCDQDYVRKNVHDLVHLEMCG
ncbi:hypothetical protein ACFLTG_00080 [Chloroflexota bacterium]